MPAATVPAAAESAAAKPSAEPGAAALSTAEAREGGGGVEMAAASVALSLELGQQVNASDLVVHSSNGMTGWSANESSDGGMGAFTIHELFMHHACARDEDACLHAHARAPCVWHARHEFAQQAPLPGARPLTHIHLDTKSKCMAHAGALIWSKSAAGRNARAARPTSGGFRPAMPPRRMSKVASR